ncbi:hypothetical protein LIER_21565 [Lithospermum erythrorhizon]|uniref:Uncharacterized protein n=1 Tax=Lithospermum erythrorhizon TaxID=34254 RepID=A0AAV3QTL9_LITER
MSFKDRLDAVPLPKGFVLPQFTQFGRSGDLIKHLQGFLAKMTITSNNPDICKVRMRRAPDRRDKNCYCEYHREHGHDTNECRIFKSEIEKLIKKGYLKEFVDRDNQRELTRQNHQSPNYDNRLRVKNEPLQAPLLAGPIDTIVGGIGWWRLTQFSEELRKKRSILYSRANWGKKSTNKLF